MESILFKPDYKHYLNLPDEKLLFNPLYDVSIYQKEDNELIEFYKLSNEFYSPEFGIRYILNTNLYPFQMATIRAMLKHKFPMLLFTRGGGKCITGDSLILSENGILKIEECFGEYNGELEHIKSLNIGVHNGNKMCRTAFGVCNAKSKTIKIKTCRGLEIEGTPEHKIKVSGINGNIIWKRLDEITNKDKIVLSRGNKIFGKNNTLTEEISHYLGLLTGDGCLSRDNIFIFSSKDDELIDIFRKITKELFNKDISKKRNICDYVVYGKKERKILLEKYGLIQCKSYFKEIPLCVRQSPQNIVASFIKGLFDTDGTVSNKSIDFCSTSINLIKQLQVILLNFGIISKWRERKTKSKFGKAYILTISGNNIDIFDKEIGFCCKRKHIRLKELIGKKKNTNIDFIPDIKESINVVLSEIKGKIKLNKWYINKYRTSYSLLEKIIKTCELLNHSSESLSILKKCFENNYFYTKVIDITQSNSITYDFNVPDGNTFISNGMISHNTFLLAIYALIHSILFPGTKVVLISASFRQSKQIFQAIKVIYDKAPLLRAMSSDPPSTSIDRCQFYVGGSSIIALPLGQGDKIRGERGHVILVDEFDSIPSEIFDVVVRGFGATQADPWEKTKSLLLKRKGIGEILNSAVSQGNKIVLSGTAGFRCGTLFKMFSFYSKVLSHKMAGKAREFQDILGGEYDEGINIDYRDYCIARFRYEELPAGMMDLSMIQNARATMPKILFDMEYNTIFADDNAGFFKARDIDAATSKYPDGFSLLLKGRPGRSYIFGVDPARTTDRFAISIIEIGSPNKLVYLWTCQNKKYSESTKKLRELMRLFPPIGISMDAGGGGLAVEELINTKECMGEGDIKVYRNDNEDKTISQESKILYMIDFTSDWIDDSNTLLQKNIEDKFIMFPMQFVSNSSDEADEVLSEILYMKKELTSIEITYTKTGKKHFDLAPVDLKKEAGDQVKHKDRYSSILLANYLASRYGNLNNDSLTNAKKIYSEGKISGGWIEDIAKDTEGYLNS